MCAAAFNTSDWGDITTWDKANGDPDKKWTGPGVDIIKNMTNAAGRRIFYLFDIDKDAQVDIEDNTTYTEMPEICYFKAWRNEDFSNSSNSSSPEKYELDIEWWEVFACKLAFVLCFEVRHTEVFYYCEAQ